MVRKLMLEMQVFTSVQEQGEWEISPEVSVDTAASSSVSPHAPSFGQVVSKLTINNNCINNLILYAF